MLGWFKKKFGRKKKEEVAQPVESQELAAVEEEVVSAPEEAPVAEVPPVEEPEPQVTPVDIDAEEVVEESSESAEDKQDEQDEQPVAVVDAPEQELEPEIEQVVATPEDTEENLEPEGEAPQPDAVEVPDETVVDDTLVVEETATDFVKEEAPEKEPQVEIDPGEQEKEPEHTELPEEDDDFLVEAAIKDTDEPVVEESEELPETTIEEEPPVDETVDDDLKEEEEESPELVQQQVEEALVVEETKEEPQESTSLFKRLQDRLGKTRDSLVNKVDTLLLGKKEIDQELFDDLEEILITADLGVDTAMDLLEYARKTVKRDKLSDPSSLKAVLKQRIHEYIKASDQPAEMVMPDKGPFVIMVVGVNGVGKTTTIGKIANKFVVSGQSVLLVAGDTFRAAAIDQLKIWADRVGVEVVAQKPGSDPSSVVFDGMEYGIANKHDVIIIDTAGRLHTSVNLMEELKKIRRVIGKKMSSAPHEVMLVLDATTGQNGISQAKLFDAAVDITGLTLSKLDGTAKGGIVANICREMKIPVRFIGIGEQMDDLRDFDSSEFVDALFGEDSQNV